MSFDSQQWCVFDILTNTTMKLISEYVSFGHSFLVGIIIMSNKKFSSRRQMPP